MNTSRFSTLASTLAVLAEAIPTVVSRDPRCYPFVGVKAVKARLAEDTNVQLATIAMLYHFQTPVEQQKRDTCDDNRRGFMSSDAWTGSKIAEKIVDGQELTAEEWDRGQRMAVKYSRQLSVALRNKAMADDPALAQTARMFSIA